jgi:hypothetical protein
MYGRYGAEMSRQSAFSVANGCRQVTAEGRASRASRELGMSRKTLYKASHSYSRLPNSSKGGVPRLGWSAMPGAEKTLLFLMRYQNEGLSSPLPPVGSVHAIIRLFGY